MECRRLPGNIPGRLGQGVDRFVVPPKKPQRETEIVEMLTVIRIWIPRSRSLDSALEAGDRFFKLSPPKVPKPEPVVASHVPGVAAKRFPDLPASVKAPWDLGEMAWNQLPPAWRGVVDRLQPGQVSDVIQGEAGRSWIVKLVSRRVDPTITFETEKDRIVDALRQQKATELYEATLAEARAKARIVYAKGPPAPRED